jgi:CRISPR system Cascade subunit CasC
MTLPRFLQIHTLHNYPAALLNRDDAGLAKRLPYGDAIRTRISSQCLKRHWRVADDAFALKNLDVPMAVRSRAFVERIETAMLAEGVEQEIAKIVASALRDALKKPIDKLLKEASKPKKKSKKSDETEAEGADNASQETDSEQKQAILLGVAEYEYLKQSCLQVAKSTSAIDARKDLLLRLKAEQENWKQIPLNSGLESALFGRMVTSDMLASRDASIYVAHAFTVHEAQVENDYFTVVDDLLREAGEASSAGIFDTELASGLYYGYLVVDVPQLVANLEGVHIKDWAHITAEQRALAGRVVQSLLHLVATVSPGAKRGSTAPFEWAKFMLVEAGDWQPRSLAGAFHNAMPLRQPALRQTAVQRLSDEIARIDAAYGAPLARRYLAVDDVTVPGAQQLPLKALAEWAQTAVLQANVEV